MHIARTALVIIISSLLLWSSVSPALPSNESPGPAALTTAEVELIEWSRARFALVGLELPPVEVSFHGDPEPCGGNHGTLNRDGSRLRVLVCIPDRGTSGSQLQRQRTLVHELAHAWEQANLTDGERAGLLGILGADDWYAPDAAWEERGAERFAETVVWGLYDQRRRPMMIEVACAELHADFLTITGHGALGPIDRVCDVDAE